MRITIILGFKKKILKLLSGNKLFNRSTCKTQETGKSVLNDGICGSESGAGACVQGERTPSRTPCLPWFPSGVFPRQLQWLEGTSVQRRLAWSAAWRSQASAPWAGKGWLGTVQLPGRQAAREAQRPVHCSQETCQAAGFLKMKRPIYINRYCLVLIKLLYMKDPVEMLQCVVITISSEKWHSKKSEGL